jgi:hypothetical protein
MKVLSLLSTVTPSNSKAAIEHEIICIKNTNNLWLILVYIENTCITNLNHKYRLIVEGRKGFVNSLKS